MLVITVAATYSAAATFTVAAPVNVAMSFMLHVACCHYPCCRLQGVAEYAATLDGTCISVSVAICQC